MLGDVLGSRFLVLRLQDVFVSIDYTLAGSLTVSFETAGRSMSRVGKSGLGSLECGGGKGSLVLSKSIVVHFLRMVGRTVMLNPKPGQMNSVTPWRRSPPGRTRRQVKHGGIEVLVPVKRRMGRGFHLKTADKVYNYDPKKEVRL